MSEKETAKPPILSVRGNLVGLAAWTEQHVDRWMEALQDPEITVYGDGAFLLPIREEEAAILEGLKKREAAPFAIYALENMKLIGNCGLFGISYRRRIATFGISIFEKDYWSKGYGTEATRLIVDYGFRFLNLHNILLDTMSYNKRAIRAYEKAGFKLIGYRREALPLGGKVYDMVLMDCIATDFESPKPGWYLPE